ncbi:efflux RND transporter periplasmic adaptor subunit [Planotetraspora sp. A-T 1434]|uniref:peptidoglycan-binding protein n=1 Tax=Planotetraspora sp. A-T 1434 TaxID=2979219 RepID=UPI0021C10B90|nr:efflux RND transporter periplasmic adaptor subunit [Planotetraspora sp. A-T 1434]MCT9934607.1 efflux RND transporter periplasmic adaptor subunit [Planotetraspora sp. A-T 1434]
MTAPWGRRVGTIAVVVGLGVGLAGAAMAVLGRPASAPPAPQVSTGTAPVTRGTVVERVRFAGTLGFDGSYPVAHQAAAGILTALAKAGSTVTRGAALYAVANQPVRLLYGAVPAYRDLRLGMTAGPDVRQLEKNIVALGLDPGRCITVDETFTAATAAAVRRWQAKWGLPAAQRTGALPLGAVVFAPGALRIAQPQAAVGTRVGPGIRVLTATSTHRVVTADIPTGRSGSLNPGDAVKVTVAGAAPVPGTLARISRVATAQQDQNGQPGVATVQVTVKLTLPSGTADLDQAPVGLLVSSATKQNVLLVPLAALTPKPGGGFRVRLSTGDYVEVRPGLYDEVAGTVEVTGALTPGQLVEVPAR